MCCYIHNVCGVISYRLGNVSIALKHFEAVLVLEFENADALANIGFIYTQKGRHKAAEAQFLQANESITSNGK